MKALFEARLEDLGPGDFFRIECVCGHPELPTAQILATAGVKRYEVLLGLHHKLRCRECDERGRCWCR